MLKKILKLIPGLAIIAYLAYTFDLRAIAKTISVARPLFLILGISIYAVTFLILTTRWKRILSNIGVKIPLLSAYQAFVGGVLLSDVTPFRLGDFSRPYLVKKHMELGEGVASVAIDRYIDILAILSLSSVGFLLLYLNKILTGRTAIFLLLSFSILVLFFLIGTILLWLKRAQIINLITGVIKRAKSRFNIIPRDQLNSFLMKFDEGMSVVKSPTQLLTISVLLTFLAWITHALRVSLVAQSVGCSLPLIFLFCLLPTISALSLVPLFPAGLGLVEGGLAALMSLFGIPLYVGLSIALLDRALTVFFHILVGSRYSSHIADALKRQAT